MPSWKGKSRGGSFGHRFFIFLIKTLGIRFAYFFLVFVVIHFVPFAPLATRSNWIYYRKILQYGFFKTVRMLYVNYYRFGQVLIDKIATKSGFKDRYHYEFENYNQFLSILNSNTGVILIGAHVGNWEAGGNFFGEYANKIHVVMYDAEYQKIKKVLEDNTGKTPYDIIPITEQSFEHIFQIKEALENKEYVCFQGDRSVSDKATQSLDFMGKPALFPTGPFQIAARYQVPVVFYFSMREKGMKYRFKFTIATTSATDKQPQVMHSLMKQYVHALEEILQQYPEQWFNYYNFWNE